MSTLHNFSVCQDSSALSLWRSRRCLLSQDLCSANRAVRVLDRDIAVARAYYPNDLVIWRVHRFARIILAIIQCQSNSDSDSPCTTCPHLPRPFTKPMNQAHLCFHNKQYTQLYMCAYLFSRSPFKRASTDFRQSVCEAQTALKPGDSDGVHLDGSLVPLCDAICRQTPHPAGQSVAGPARYRPDRRASCTSSTRTASCPCHSSLAHFVRSSVAFWRVQRPLKW